MTHQVDLFNQYATTYSQRHNEPYLQGRLAFLTRCIPAQATGRLLDVGTGVGVITHHLEQRYPSLAIQGIDYSPAMIANRLYHQGAVGDVEHLAFADQTFEWIVASDVIEHVEHPSRMLRECARCLTLGGRLLLTTPNPLWVPLLNLTGTLHLSLSAERLISLSQLMRVSAAVGLSVTHAVNVNFLPSILWQMIRSCPSRAVLAPSTVWTNLGFLTRCFNFLKEPDGR